MADAPGSSVTGNVVPEIANPLPPIAAELIVTGAVPDEVKVSVWVDAVFSVTLPNASAVALAVNCDVDGAVPVPLSETVAVPPFDAVLDIVMAPLAAPTTVGLKVT